MTPSVSIIIPTWNNPEDLEQCVRSISRVGVLNTGLVELLLINNGSQPVESEYGHLQHVRVFTPGENLGWERGLALGLQHSTAPFVVFQNDDTILPVSSVLFYERLMIMFHDPALGIAFPTTTMASGIQSCWHPQTPVYETRVSWGIFFTAMVRRAALDAVGGIETTLPGGDDIDLCIRMTKAGWTLRVNPACFLLHQGFRTGNRVKGDHTVQGGWNSPQMQDATNAALIRKHGFSTFFSTVSQQILGELSPPCPDLEGDLLRSWVLPGERVLELACGFRKTIPDSVGVDLVAQGQRVPIRENFSDTSVADLQADVCRPLPFPDASVDVVIGRHILEHVVDLIGTLQHWKRVLKPGGRLLLAVPDEDLVTGIPLSPDHRHAFTKASLQAVVELVGFTTVVVESSNNGISFCAQFQSQGESVNMTTTSRCETWMHPSVECSFETTDSGMSPPRRTVSDDA